MTFELFGKTYTAANFAEASALFSAARDKSGRGASTMPLPAIMQDGVVIGHFSYNGRVWEKPSALFSNDSAPIYDNRAA